MLTQRGEVDFQQRKIDNKLENKASSEVKGGVVFVSVIDIR